MQRTVSVPNNCKVDSFTSVDLRGSYTYGDAWEFNASIKNLLDTTAPFDPYTYGGLNYNPVFHQQGAIGRSFSVGLKYSFQQILPGSAYIGPLRFAAAALLVSGDYESCVTVTE